LSSWRDGSGKQAIIGLHDDDVREFAYTSGAEQAPD
jgi:hypothetical protein